MNASQKIAIVIASLTTLVALGLVIDRGGLIAWLTLILGAAFVAILIFRPISGIKAVVLSAMLAVIPSALWIGTVKYVIKQWESGEVVELLIDTEQGPHTARLWVFNIDHREAVYYDADPEVAHALLAGKPLQFTRAGNVSTRIPAATRVDTLPEEQANQILESMQTKYGELNSAATIWYVMLGSPNDRIPVVVYLSPA